MDAETSTAVLELNRRFYRELAPQFSATRQRPWPGWSRVLARYAGRRGGLSILDLGCGNGRFAAACADRLEMPWTYIGVDASPELVAEARHRLRELGKARSRALEGDLLAVEDALPRGPFDLVTLFGVMHHVPGTRARGALLARAAACVAPGGVLAVSYWQLGDSPRLMARTVEPETLGLTRQALDAGDYLLRWGEGEAVRYCHHCRPEEAALLSAELGWQVVDAFRADGEDGAMNLYQLLAQPADRPAEDGPANGAQPPSSGLLV